MLRLSDLVLYMFDDIVQTKNPKGPAMQHSEDATEEPKHHSFQDEASKYNLVYSNSNYVNSI